MCRLRSISSAIQSAPHPIISEHPLLCELYKGSIYRGAIDCSEHNSPQAQREKFIKETANSHKANAEITYMSTTKFRVKGIFFDLDGTIVDSREAYLEAARTAFEALGKTPLDDKTALEIPKRLEQRQPLTDIINDSNTKKFLEAYLRTYYSITPEKTKLIPNAQTALQTLSQKAKLALVTMRFVPQHTIKTELTHFGIADNFTHIVTALDTHKPKPSPEALIKTVQAMDVQICDCIMVGDSVTDIQAGKAAGTKTIAVLTGLFTQKELTKQNPDLILKNVTELPKHIQ